MIKVMFNFQWQKSGINICGYVCVKHRLYFLESAAALNELLYLLLKRLSTIESCKVKKTIFLPMISYQYKKIPFDPLLMSSDEFYI